MRTLWPLTLLCVAALAACSVDKVTFTLPVEDCQTAGDEDGNRLADCNDPACASAPSCPQVCGNGRVEAAERCDDGNTTDADGCDSNCTMTACGNGVVTVGEVCDDGNAMSWNGCNHNGCSSFASDSTREVSIT